MTASDQRWRPSDRHRLSIWGEEFVLLLPFTDEKEAMIFCERLREKTARRVVKWKDTFIGITVSIGVAQYDETKDLSLTSNTSFNLSARVDSKKGS